MNGNATISAAASRGSAPATGQGTRPPKAPRAFGRWPSRLIVISGIALALLCDAFVGLVLYSNYEETHRAAERADADLVRVLDEYTQRTVQALQLSLRVTADQLASNPAYLSPGNPDLIAALRRTISIYPAVQALVVLDADGNLISDSLGNGVPGRQFNFSDRLYYQVHRNNPYSGLFIDVPRRARANANQYFIAVSLALRGPDERFDGVVFAALDYEQIRQFFVSLDVGRNGAVNLLRDDGALMVRVPTGEDFIGRSFDQSLLFLRYLPQASAGSYLGSNLIGGDGDLRRVTYRKISGLPLVVSISRPEVEILALWRKGAWQYGAAAAALNFMIIALGFMLARQWRLREQSQRATAAALAQARQVTDIVPAAIISVGPDLKIRFANSTVGDWYAKPVDEIIGNPISSFVPAAVLDRFRPAIEAALLGHNSREEQRVLLPDGRERWVDFTRVSDVAPEGTLRGFVTLAVDVTARRQAEERLRESELHFRKVFETSPDGIYVHVDGRIVVANPAAARMFGFDGPESLLGVETVSLYHPDSLARILVRRQALMRGDVAEQAIEHRYRRRDGSEFNAEAEATSFVWQGQRGILVVVRDITERKQFEKELIAARDRAEIASRAKSEFLANMSHELRTPLNAIIGFAEILKDARLGGIRPASEYAADIHQSGLHLLNIINDVLDMAKIEAGKVDLDQQLIEIDAEIGAALRLIAPRAQDGGLKLKTEIASSLPSLYADRRVFKQIMLNLLSNAVKFTPSGGTITVSAWRDGGGNLLVAVSDTGIGIAEADLDRVLQPFGQAESGLARRYEGTGLGLPICKALTELHGGTIDIASVPGQGTTVTIRFPADRVRPRAA